jgi:hypothetical protein
MKSLTVGALVVVLAVVLALCTFNLRQIATAAESYTGSVQFRSD